MTSPECCTNCKHGNKPYQCRNHQSHCPPWRKWFHTEWAKIQRAAAPLVERSKEGK